MLVLAIHDRHRIEMHPPVQNCRIDAAEVHVRVEITLNELARVERWHFTVVSALDLLAKHERNAGGAMIRSGTVVAHATAERRQNSEKMSTITLSDLSCARRSAMKTSRPLFKSLHRLACMGFWPACVSKLP